MDLSEQQVFEDNSQMTKAVYEDLAYAINHGIVVSNLAYNVAEELGENALFCHEMATAGLLHDIGKLRLCKYLYGRSKDTLKIEEMKYVRMHSKFSYQILQKENYDPFILESIYHHHENYDGSGYPDNLKADDIPFGARILRVCDVFAALVSDRPYREAFDIDTAVELMIDEVKNFDMKVFLAFQRFINSDNFKKTKKLIQDKSSIQSLLLKEEQHDYAKTKRNAGLVR